MREIEQISNLKQKKLYCNLVPIIFYSKSQNTVENLTFGEEFVALRNATNLYISLRYKLKMIGITI